MKKHSPKDILDQWMQAVNGADVESLLNLYDPHAVLIPTFSNRILNTPEKLRDYFEKLGSRPELSIALHEKTLTVQEMKSDQYTLGGIYNWRFAVDGELLNFEARFSYVIDLANPNPILHHHSSQIPRTL
ncbi:nuclear transport factor 2 family protein [Microbulbifer sp. HZ11]|uniref:nuclear transport factor 2 family protein n=1 Tax=Microbulbifer sp. HZ11 TaxID=1453501 RepID=UPI0005BBF169|nr:nuclear transport factor 2 family protein [Microbulbifer sp. HZ11]